LNAQRSRHTNIPQDQQVRLEAGLYLPSPCTVG
jgi:hypothetical protein